MKITVDGLLVLEAINTHGSFASAAKSLHRVPSAISYSMKKLEQDLDIQLFNRAGYKAVLTSAGHLLLEEGQHLLNAITDLENQVKKVSDGWELELRIAIGNMYPIDNLLSLIKIFYNQQSGTRIKLLNEVYGGIWDALVTDRADLVIGAPSEGPAGGGYHTRPLDQIEWVFAVAANHPLTKVAEPLTENIISKYRVIAVADTSRNLAPRTAGIFTGQDVFTVSDFETKIKAHIQGIGVGFLPRRLIQQELKQGLLIEKQLETENETSATFLAWRTGKNGRSLQWFLEHIDDTTLYGMKANHTLQT